MKHLRLMSAFCVLAFSAVMLTSCEKQISDNETAPPQRNVARMAKASSDIDFAAALVNGVVVNGNVDVQAGSSFTIDIAFWCGKARVSRGYVVAEDGVTKIYNGLSCDASNLLWEDVSDFTCDPNVVDAQQTLTEAGTYVYQYQLQQSSSNGGDCSKDTKCNAFKGQIKKCFTVTAVTE